MQFGRLKRFGMCDLKKVAIKPKFVVDVSKCLLESAHKYYL
jgi:hypothetical protein